MSSRAARIHPSAVVDSAAELEDDVVVGPFSYVGAGVCIREGSELIAHATVLGPSRIGPRSRIFPHAVLGAPPQDRTHSGEATFLETGEGCVFREQVTVHRGTVRGGGTTRLGARCLLMVGAHVAHDCVLGDDVVLTNLTTLGGHVRVDASAVCGGAVAVQPFVHLGRACFLAGGAMVERPVPPFTIAAGDRARVRAVNRVGLRRLSVPSSSRQALERAFRMLWRSGETLESGVTASRAELGADPFVAELVDFVELELLGASVGSTRSR